MIFRLVEPGEAAGLVAAYDRAVARAQRVRALLVAASRLDPGNRWKVVTLLRHWSGGRQFGSDEGQWQLELAAWARWFGQTFPKEPALPAAPLKSEGDGYFSGTVAAAVAGDRYRFRLDGGDALYPDPASRFQPHGPHGASQVIDPAAFPYRNGVPVGRCRLRPGDCLTVADQPLRVD